MTTDLHPEEGARYLFERDEGAEEEAATYSAAIYTPDQRFEYRVVVRLDGDFETSPEGPPAEAELAKRLDRFARQIARAAQGKLDDGLPPWPARVLRWRGPGRG